jgi:predicted kinase
MSTKLVLVVGIGGSGKSTLAKRISTELGFQFIDSHKLKERVGDKTLISSHPHPARKAAYRLIYNELFNRLARGQSVVTDAPHALEMPNPHFLRNLKQRLRRRGIPADVKIIWVKANNAVLKKTMQNRRKPSDLYKLNNWRDFEKSELMKFKVPHAHFLAKRPGYKFDQIRDYLLH